MESDSGTYYLARAQQERARAAALPSDDPAGIAHRKLAEHYEARVQSEGRYFGEAASLQIVRTQNC